MPCVVCPDHGSDRAASAVCGCQTLSHATPTSNCYRTGLALLKYTCCVDEKYSALYVCDFISKPTGKDFCKPQAPIRNPKTCPGAALATEVSKSRRFGLRLHTDKQSRRKRTSCSNVKTPSPSFTLSVCMPTAWQPLQQQLRNPLRLTRA